MKAKKTIALILIVLMGICGITYIFPVDTEIIIASIVMALGPCIGGVIMMHVVPTEHYRFYKWFFPMAYIILFVVVALFVIYLYTNTFINDLAAKTRLINVISSGALGCLTALLFLITHKTKETALSS